MIFEPTSKVSVTSGYVSRESYTPPNQRPGGTYEFSRVYMFFRREVYVLKV